MHNRRKKRQILPNVMFVKVRERKKICYLEKGLSELYGLSGEWFSVLIVNPVTCMKPDWSSNYNYYLLLLLYRQAAGSRLYLELPIKSLHASSPRLLSRCTGDNKSHPIKVAVYSSNKNAY